MSSFRCKRWDVEEAHESGGGRRCSLRSRRHWQVAHFVELMSELAFWGHLVSGLEATVLGSGVKSVKWMRRGKGERKYRELDFQIPGLVFNPILPTSDVPEDSKFEIVNMPISL